MISRFIRLKVIVAGLAIGGFASPVCAQQSPEEPATQRERTAHRRHADFFARVRAAVRKLDDQKQMVGDIVSQAIDEAQHLRETAQAQGQEIVFNFRQLIQETRDKLENVLSDEQKQKLQDLFRSRHDRDPQDQQEQ